MDLVEIDIVRAETAQAVLGGLANVLRPRALARLIELHAELGGDHHLSPPAAESAAQILLAVALVIDVCGIEEINAGIERGLHHAAGLRFIHAPSEIIAAQTGERNFQGADLTALRSGCWHDSIDASRRAGIQDRARIGGGSNIARRRPMGNVKYRR